MSDREKLFNLFHEHNASYVTFCDSCFSDTPEELNSKMYDLAEHLLSNGATFRKWIPVSQCLPEPFCDVLIYDATFQMVVMGYITQHKEWIGVCMKNDITHWMPMPEPPKEV